LVVNQVDDGELAAGSVENCLQAEADVDFREALGTGKELPVILGAGSDNTGSGSDQAKRDEFRCQFRLRKHRVPPERSSLESYASRKDCFASYANYLHYAR